MISCINCGSENLKLPRDTDGFGECAIFRYDVKDESLINEQHICNAMDGVRQ